MTFRKPHKQAHPAPKTALAASDSRREASQCCRACFSAAPLAQISSEQQTCALLPCNQMACMAVYGLCPRAFAFRNRPVGRRHRTGGANVSDCARPERVGLPPLALVFAAVFFQQPGQFFEGCQHETTERTQYAHERPDCSPKSQPCSSQQHKGDGKLRQSRFSRQNAQTCALQEIVAQNENQGTNASYQDPQGIIPPRSLFLPGFFLPGHRLPFAGMGTLAPCHLLLSRCGFGRLCALKCGMRGPCVFLQFNSGSGLFFVHGCSPMMVAGKCRHISPQMLVHALLFTLSPDAQGAAADVRAVRAACSPLLCRACHPARNVLWRSAPGHRERTQQPAKQDLILALSGSSLPETRRSRKACRCGNVLSEASEVASELASEMPAARTRDLVCSHGNRPSVC